MEVGGGREIIYLSWGEREIIYLSLHCRHQNDFCIKMGSDESHFNVSVGSDEQSHKTVSTDHNLFEEKGEPKRYRTEVLPLTSLKPYRQAKPAHTFYNICILIVMYYAVCYFTGIFYAVVWQFFVLFIDNKDSVFCIL